MRNRWRQHRLQAPTLFLDEETKEFTKRDTQSEYQTNVQRWSRHYARRSRMAPYYERSNNYR